MENIRKQILAAVCCNDRTQLVLDYMRRISAECAAEPVVYSVVVIGGNVLITGFFSAEWDGI